jgi:hypothetical protein
VLVLPASRGYGQVFYPFDNFDSTGRLQLGSNFYAYKKKVKFLSCFQDDPNSRLSVGIRVSALELRRPNVIASLEDPEFKF